MTGGAASAPVRRRILLVEDEAIIARDLARTLERLGFEVVGVESRGEDAIERVAADPPDLVLMDIRLRGAIDGIEAADAVWRRHAVPSVFLTAWADDETVARAARNGSFGYLVKPFEARELRATIEIALRRGAEGRLALRREESFFDLLSSLGDAVVQLDGEGRVTRANGAAERLLGRRAGELAEESAPVAALLGGESGSTAPEATGRGLRVCRLPLAGLRGEGEIVLFLDPRSELDRGQQLLRREVSEVLRQMIAGIVHEVGNPLFVLGAGLDLMSLAPASAPASGRSDGELVARMRTQVERLRTLLGYLAQLAPDAAVERRSTPLAPLVAAALREGESFAGAKPVELAFDASSAASAAAAAVDAASFRLACDHLVANAVHFAPAGSRVRARVVAREGADGGRELACEFDNEGPPVAAGDLPRLFTPFFSRREHGHGLGLAVVRRIVEEAGGRVSAENLERGGVRFTIVLPEVD